VAYTSAMTLSQLAADITSNVTGVTASVVTDGAGVRLQMTGSSAFTFTETGGGTAIADLGINNNRKIIQRTSNTIDDLFAGVTLSLFAAETGTTISLDIEQDLSQVKTEIVSFVDSYNAMRQYVNANRLIDSATGDLDEETGILAKSQALSEVAGSMARIIGAGVAGVDPNFTVLSQIGVNFVGITQEDPLLAENLEIDETLLDSMLLSNADDVRKLFSFDLTSSDPRVTLLGFNGSTTYNSAGYTLNLQPSTGGNQFQYSEQLDNAYWTTQFGVIAINNTLAPDGKSSADGIVADASLNTHRVRTATAEPVTNGTSYIYSTYAKAGDKDKLLLQVNGAGFGGPESAEFDLVNGVLVGAPTAGVSNTSIEDAGNGWYRVSMKVTAVADSTAFFEQYPVDVTPTFAGDGSTVNTFLWGAQLEPVTTEITPGAYIPTTIAIGNQLLYSEQADNAYWTATRATVSADSIASPSGAMTADGLVGDASNATHYLSTTVGPSFVSGENYVFSTYVKAVDKNNARIAFNGAAFGGTPIGADFDLVAGTVTSTDAGVSNSNIEDVGDGWFRVSIKATAVATSTANLERYSKDVTTTFAGDGATENTYFWGAQLEGVTTATTPGTYFPTTTAPVYATTSTANINGAVDGTNDGSVTVNGNLLTVNSGGAEGLQLFFSGLQFTSSTQLDLTIGIGAQMYFKLGELLDVTTGIVDGEIDELTDQNTLNNERITEMLDRLEIQRQNLLERYISMETAIASANRIMDSLKQTTDQLANSNR
jgi:hypothetical protein